MQHLAKKRLPLAGALFLLAGLFFIFSLTDLLGGNSSRENQQRAGQQSPDATPGTGTLNPTGPSVPWTGAPGTIAGSLDESTCIEGQNCDTFVITLSGTHVRLVGQKGPHRDQLA